MWDLPRPGLEPVSPALAGRFSTTAPPGKPPTILYVVKNKTKHLCMAWPLLAFEVLAHRILLTHSLGTISTVHHWMWKRQPLSTMPTVFLSTMFSLTVAFFPVIGNSYLPFSSGVKISSALCFHRTIFFCTFVFFPSFGVVPISVCTHIFTNLILE